MLSHFACDPHVGTLEAHSPYCLQERHAKHGSYYLNYKALKRAIKALQSDPRTKGAERTEITNLFRKELEMINSSTQLLYEDRASSQPDHMCPPPHQAEMCSDRAHISISRDI